MEIDFIFPSDEIHLLPRNELPKGGASTNPLPSVGDSLLIGGTYWSVVHRRFEYRADKPLKVALHLLSNPDLKQIHTGTAVPVVLH